jgi:hypothetical protein
VTEGDLDLLRVSVEIKRDHDTVAAVAMVEERIRRMFEVSPKIVLLPAGSLAKEFESAIKAPRILDLRPGMGIAAPHKTA